MKASKALTVSVSVFRGWILWHFSLSKNNISPAAPDLELILFPLWYWPIMNSHTKQQDKVFETDFNDSQKSDPPFVHLLALVIVIHSCLPTDCQADWWIKYSSGCNFYSDFWLDMEWWFANIICLKEKPFVLSACITSQNVSPFFFPPSLSFFFFFF